MHLAYQGTRNAKSSPHRNMTLELTENDAVRYQYQNSTMLFSGRQLQAIMNVTFDTAAIEETENDIFSALYRSMVFLVALYICGDILCGKMIQIVPPLVGQIGMGILLGPRGLDLLGNSSSCWPVLGELGLVLMLCQAGLEMDFHVLQAVGPRGALMALVGSILPSGIGFLLARFALDLPVDTALAVGCSFGPTSAGIALNVLQQCGGILKTPLGQLIVAIAIVDDIIALVVLSQLQALTGTGEGDSIDAASVVIPIVSALLWLFLGGGAALYAMPRVLESLSLAEQSVMNATLRFNNKNENSSSNASEIMSNSNEEPPQSTLPSSVHLAHIFILLFALLPATYFSQASHLLGAFLAGLSVCQQPLSARLYNHELGKILAWLMRIFFGASIAFRIPVELFADERVIGTGFLLSLSLLGKIATGPLLTPVNLGVDQKEADHGVSSEDCVNIDINTDATRLRYDKEHLRDCLVVGFSMAGEAEFAMLVATFGFTEGLMEEDVYASTVFAILLSTILSPCLLRLTLAILPDTARQVPLPKPSHWESNDSLDGDQEEEENLESSSKYCVNRSTVNGQDEKDGFDVNGLLTSSDLP